MNVVSATVLKNNLTNTIDEITRKRDYLLVAKKGRVTSALVDIEFFEDLLTLADKKYRATIQKARKEYEQGEIFTHDQVFGS